MRLDEKILIYLVYFALKKVILEKIFNVLHIYRYKLLKGFQMTIKKILTVPNPFLRKEAVPVKNITNEIKQLLDDMLETMYNAKGIGLAATQIKDNRRLVQWIVVKKIIERVRNLFQTL